jgi:hypothetical protein
MLAAMDERANRRAAIVTLRRAIRERFPPGVERTRWLRWAARAAKSSTPAQPVPVFPIGHAGCFERAYRDAIYRRAPRCQKRFGYLRVSTREQVVVRARAISHGFAMLPCIVGEHEP